MNDDKKKQLTEWLENMPWWDELPYAKLEADNEELRELLIEQDAKTFGIHPITQEFVLPWNADESYDWTMRVRAVLVRNTQEPT